VYAKYVLDLSGDERKVHVDVDEAHGVMANSQYVFLAVEIELGPLKWPV